MDDDYIIGMMKDVILPETDYNDEDSENDSDDDEEELDPIKIEDDIILGDIETLDNSDTEDVLAVDIPEEKRSSVAEKTEKELENYFQR